MTIAAGFVCNNGVVLATDSQFSGQIKRSGTKTWKYGDGDKVIAVAAAGQVVYINEFIDGIEGKFKGTLPEHLLQMAKDIVYPMLLRHADADLWILLAIRTASGVTLYENQCEGTFAKVRTASQCYGSGKGLGNYIAEQHFNGEMSVQAGRNVAVFMLKQTKKYESDTVGGESQIIVVPSQLDASPELVEQHTILALEAQLANRERAAAAIVAGIGIAGIDLNSETAQRRQETIDTAVSAMNTTYQNLSGVQATMKIGDMGPQAELEDLSGVVQPAIMPPD